MEAAGVRLTSTNAIVTELVKKLGESSRGGGFFFVDVKCWVIRGSIPSADDIQEFIGERSMLQLRPLDELVPIQKQLTEAASPVILVNLFTVASGDVADLLNAWEADANWMKLQPGYISTQLHRGIGGSCLFLNYAVWESVAHFRAAFSHPDFQSALSAYPSSAIASPHLFEKLTVPNLCVA